MILMKKINIATDISFKKTLLIKTTTKVQAIHKKI